MGNVRVRCRLRRVGVVALILSIPLLLFSSAAAAGTTAPIATTNTTTAIDRSLQDSDQGTPVTVSRLAVRFITGVQPPPAELIPEALLAQLQRSLGRPLTLAPPSSCS